MDVRPGTEARVAAVLYRRADALRSAFTNLVVCLTCPTGYPPFGQHGTNEIPPAATVVCFLGHIKHDHDAHHESLYESAQHSCARPSRVYLAAIPIAPNVK